MSSSEQIVSNVKLDNINKKGWNVKDVPAAEFIEAFARHLKKGNKIKMPEWVTYYKTACFKDLAPYDPDWLYIRAASIAYQLYMRRKVGVNTLRKHYSKKQRNGTCTEHSRLTAGKCIRYCLIELEHAQLAGKMSFEDSRTRMETSFRLVRLLPRRVPLIWIESPLKLPRRRGRTEQSYVCS
jgi:small subunit ribosomal protein S19e